MSDLLLPPGSRLVHIGPQKTGTTSIQVAMSRSRASWPEHGAYYPEGPFRRRKAGWALGLPGGPTGVAVPIGHWTDLVEEVHAAGDLRVCVSDEGYARADVDIARRIVADLGGDRVHVVAVVRRLDLYLPSQWQERVKSGVTASYEDWLGQVLGDDGSDRERWNVWQGHDIVGLAERWLQVVDPDRFVLVVSDESDRRMLPRVFAQLLGLPDDMLATPTSDRANVGLGWSELEVVRALHDVFRRNGWDRPDWLRTLPEVVRSFRETEETGFGPRTPPLPDWALDRVRALSDARVEAIAALPVRVIGDPQGLRVPADAPGDQGDAQSDLGLPVSLAAAAVEGALRAERKRTAAAQRRGRRPRRRPADEMSGRELLQLATRRLAARFRGR